MEIRGRDVVIGAIILALIVVAVFVFGLQTGWNTAEPEVVVKEVEIPVKETVEVPLFHQTVEVPVIVEKPCVVMCPCVKPPCVEPCEPCEEVPEVPTVIPKATPTPTLDHELQSGETWQVPARWTCLGDLLVDGVQYYDEGPGSAESGLVIYFAESAEVYARWGANCMSGDQRKEKEAEALVSGCMGPPEGCKTVDVYVWPDDPPNN